MCYFFFSRFGYPQWVNQRFTHVCPLEATPQRAVPDQSEVSEDTIAATDSQVEKSLKGSDKGVSSPTSPASSLPSSASKSQDEVHWKIRLGNYIFLVKVFWW